MKYMEVLGRVCAIIEEKRKDPDDHGLISALVTAEIDGAPLPIEMVLSMVNLVMAGGFDTTTAVTANALIWLADNPERCQFLIDNPDMVPQACEEFLRYFTPQQGLARTVTEPVAIGGIDRSPTTECC